MSKELIEKLSAKYGIEQRGNGVKTIAFSKEGLERFCEELLTNIPNSVDSEDAHTNDIYTSSEEEDGALR